MASRCDKHMLDQINALLPQTQCQRCGFLGCRPYAQAILEGTPHNQCPPGGARVIEALSALLKREVLPLNPIHGTEGPRFLAKIREIDCIGCTKCIQVCPVDAIVGSAKHMHTVIAHECTGCELCIPACPVDCIEWESAPDDLQPEALEPSQRQEREQYHRMRHEARQERLKTQTPDINLTRILAQAIDFSKLAKE